MCLLCLRRAGPRAGLNGFSEPSHHPYSALPLPPHPIKQQPKSKGLNPPPPAQAGIPITTQPIPTHIPPLPCRLAAAYEAAVARLGGLQSATPKPVYEALVGDHPDITLQVRERGG